MKNAGETPILDRWLQERAANRKSKEQSLEELGLQISEILVEEEGKLSRQPAGTTAATGEILGDIVEERTLLVDRLLRREQYRAAFAAGYEVETLASLSSRKQYSSR